VAPRAARVFLFLLLGGSPRRRDGEEAAAALGASFLPPFLGRPGPHLSGTPSPPGARATPVAAVGVTAVAAAAARAAKVFLLWLPFGRSRFRDAGGAISGALVLFPLPSPPTAEPLREDMARQSLEERQRKEGKCALNHVRSQHLKRSSEGDGSRHFGNRSRIVCARERATATVTTADCGGEQMGRAADVCQSAPHDDSESYDGGDPEVQVTR
jgi:hypothetical protein